MQSHEPDPYVVLGVPRCASRRQIAQAYRRLAKRHHPDLDPNPTAADRMRRINAAWRALAARRDGAPRDARVAGRAHRADRTSGTAASWATWSARRGTEPVGPRVPSNRRPRTAPSHVRFVETGRAALIAVAVMVMLLFAAAYVGNVSAPTPPA